MPRRRRRPPKALERETNDRPLPDGDSLTPHRMALLVRDALLAAEELESLREAYPPKKAAEARA